MTPQQTKAVRERTLHSLRPLTAQYAGMTVEQLMQFVAGAHHPDDEQLHALARHFNLQDQVR